jgi:putative peptidoglycan lipid II flippase
MKTQVSATLKTLLPILIPVAVGMLLLSDPLIRILLERKAFIREDTLRTASCLRYFVLSMVAANVNQMLTRAFYAQKKNRAAHRFCASALTLLSS